MKLPHDHQRVAQRARSALQRATGAMPRGALVHSEGRVFSAIQGVLGIEGLADVGTEELVEIEGGALALVLGLGPGRIDAIGLDDGERVRQGARVRCLHRELSVPSGEAILGRILDPLGNPLDGGPRLSGRTRMPLERRAPGVAERSAVHEPLYTGALAVDAMFPIGRGQRELILGDEGTGKTALAVDALLRQRDTGVICIYVGIARRRAELIRIAQSLRRAGVRFAMVAAPHGCSPALRHLAPYAGTAMAEWFVERGDHALVVYDDLSAHAVAWRELSLLLRRPPGREAYPGDVFYLHSRLLERATQLAPERGGGSLTAIPIAVTEEGRLSAYIPTNLISITDGQIVLSRELFASGQKPAIDVGLSVSRVGGRAQAQALRELAGRLRLDYSAFLELETFARLGTRLEPNTARRLEIGRRVRSLLRAARGSPLGIFDELVRLILIGEDRLLLRMPAAEADALARRLARESRAALPALADLAERDAILTADGRRALVAWLERALGLAAADA